MRLEVSGTGEGEFFGHDIDGNYSVLAWPMDSFQSIDIIGMNLDNRYSLGWSRVHIRRSKFPYKTKQRDKFHFVGIASLGALENTL
ncbi:hypothetical protein DYD21_10305 [Rhodohalobacter sp. SW132]|nr:hypothetical protein DYD21_10305 [Rhodohalobacter sp. SW132]